ncbi:tryptophanase leader peptide, partial [Escherichia coli]|nr:tryptophanase leader peptide [Escherichia coli]EFE3484406.1 tryptophanase leader peptide [Escherichia coli]
KWFNIDNKVVDHRP